MNTAYKFSPYIRALHLEHLALQYSHLLFVRERHLRWMAESADPEIRDLHEEIADLLERAATEYEQLVAALQEKEK